MSKKDAIKASMDVTGASREKIPLKTYAFWNNKGGTGKTSLAFQAICEYANRHPDKKILAIDVCPQANLSELLLGGLINSGSANLLQRQGQTPRCTIGGYFQTRLPSPYVPPQITPQDYLTNPARYNKVIPTNIDLLSGDPLLELQANAIHTLANAQIPGTDTWIEIIDWLRQFIERLDGAYDVAFVDANPSFSIYTQIAIAASDRLILPVMADDSSRRAVQNAFSLIYGFKLPSPIYSSYAFATKLNAAKRALPKVHLIVKNRITQYMGPASAYEEVLSSIDADIAALLTSHPSTFSFKKPIDGAVDVRDFQTTGVVAFAKGCPFYALPTGKLDIRGRRITVKQDYLDNCIDSINGLVNKL
jgi:cellulose biosynthesis protein BcsQ